MSNPKADLGLSCPMGGKFYICESAKIRFVGCCTDDPCADGSGKCPQDSLRTSSFSSDHYNDIKPQTCVAPYNETTWYTCEASAFMGCCSTNACSTGSCPQTQLLAARLSDNKSRAQVFLSSDSATTTSDPTATSTNSANSSSSGSSVPTGAIVGASVGGAVLIFILLAILGYKCGWWARKKKSHREVEELGKSASASIASPYASHSPAFASNYWQDQTQKQINAVGSHPSSPRSNHGPPAPYSPSNFYDMPSNPYDPDPRHGGTQLSGTTWNSVAASVAKKQHFEAVEFDSRKKQHFELDSRERPKEVCELPAPDHQL